MRTRWQIEANVYVRLCFDSLPYADVDLALGPIVRDTLLIPRIQSWWRWWRSASPIPATSLALTCHSWRNNRVWERAKSRACLVRPFSRGGLKGKIGERSRSIVLSTIRVEEENFFTTILRHRDRGLFLQSYEQFNFTAVNGQFAKLLGWLGRER